MNNLEYEQEVKCCGCVKMRCALLLMSIVYVLEVQMNTQSAINSYKVEAPAFVLDVLIVLVAAYVAVVMWIAAFRDSYSNRLRVVSAIIFSLIYNTIFTAICIIWVILDVDSLFNIEKL